MMNMIMKKRMDLKKKGKKGFTLIEVIVVIVIIAILAAIAVPALTGYIDKAKNKELEAAGHNIMVALQSIGTDSYAAGGTFSGTYTGAATWGTPGTNVIKYSPISSANTTVAKEITGLTGTDYFASATSNLTDITYNKGVLTKFIYTGDRGTVTYATGSFTYAYNS
jgi:prepilin-type N-terminal cleavage/methylation domain-containing protein